MRRFFFILSAACAISLTAAIASAQHGEPAPHGASPEEGPQGSPGDHGGAAEGSTPAAHGGGHEHALKSFNLADFSNAETKPYLIMLLNFGLLVGLYYALGKKPITEALKQRRATVAKEIEEAQRMTAEAEARAKQYQAKLASLGDELEITKRALVEAGKGERDRIVREAEEKAERMTKDAVFLLEQEVKQMRQDLLKDTVEIAILAAEEILKKRVTPSDHERLAEEYLSELASRPTSQTKSIPGGAP